MWKMCWVGRGEEKSRGALSRSSCFSLVFGTGHRPIIGQTLAEVKFCSPIKRKLDDSWHLMRIWLQCFVPNQQTRKGLGWNVCNGQSFWPVEKCFLKAVCMYGVAISRQLYCECHISEKLSHLNISTHSHFLTLSVKKLQNFPIIPFWIALHCVGDAMASISLLQSFYSAYPGISLHPPLNILYRIVVQSIGVKNIT